MATRDGKTTLIVSDGNDDCFNHELPMDLNVMSRKYKNESKKYPKCFTQSLFLILNELWMNNNSTS